ncbi:MAG TPA: hypothetical protein VK209_11160 [Candidatus Sulfotelmatobacter sp.]|nr:hypothetical protein [Candidatus Sulfotelmatobacter sp.]
MAAAYVFLDLLPSLRQAGDYLKNVTGGQQLVSIYEDAIFLLVFAGFLIFFILEHIATRSRKKQQTVTKLNLKDTPATKQVFALHLFNFSFLNIILSFVLNFEFQDHIIKGILYTFAVSLHLFISNDSMIEHYKNMQIHVGRYIAAFMPIIGWSLSVIFPERLAEAYVLLALVSGVILYHSIKNEVPTVARDQSLSLFVIGAVFYSSILLAHALLLV